MSRAPRLVIDLRATAALTTAEVGAKAADLAAAAAAGLPVLPGVVLPVSASVPTLTRARASAAETGVHAARLEVMAAALSGTADFVRAAGALGPRLVVRSSSPLERDPRYSGAFASYHGIAAADLPTAIRGVWASAVREDPVSARAGIAVLVQRELDPWLAGTARVHPDGSVELVWVTGSPAALLAGGAEGRSLLLGPGPSATGQVDDGAGDEATGQVGYGAGGEAGGEVGGEVRDREGRSLVAVAALARQMRSALGHDLIEWAVPTSGQPVLFQAKSAAPGRAAPSRAAQPPDSPVILPAPAAGAARLVQAYAGPLGEQLLLPLVLAGVAPDSQATRLAPPAALRPGSALTDWMQAIALARGLLAQVWPARGPTPEQAVRALRTEAPGDAVRALAALAPAPPLELARLRQLLARVAGELLARSDIVQAEQLWGLDPQALPGLLSGPGPGQDELERHEAARGTARYHRRWVPFLHSALTATGLRYSGTAAAPGVAAGAAYFVEGLPSQVSVPAGSILVAPRPIAQLAPLLWGAAGLVTFGGSLAAHLVEVARSVGVPTVLAPADRELGQRLAAPRCSPLLVAVDGHEGLASVDRQSVFAPDPPGDISGPIL